MMTNTALEALEATTPSSSNNTFQLFLPLDEAIAYRAVLVIVSLSGGRADGNAFVWIQLNNSRTVMVYRPYVSWASYRMGLSPILHVAPNLPNRGRKVPLQNCGQTVTDRLYLLIWS